jgi:penicillin-binding protein 1A
MKYKQKLSQFFHNLANKLETSEQPPKVDPIDSKSAPVTTKNPPEAPSEEKKANLVAQTTSKAIEALKPLKTKFTTLIDNSPLPQWRQHPRFGLYLGVGLGVTGGVLGLGWGIYRLEASLPQNIAEIKTYARPDTLTIQAANGAILKQNGSSSYETVKIAQVPKVVQEAFIASEDRRFREHGGVDGQGIARAFFSNLRAGGVVEGGSTITQQLARIVFLSQERSFDRKLREMRIAQKIEDKYTKDQILERYFNLVYLGSGAYGLADAAWLYFSKPVDKLTLAEAATLAGIVPAPSLYSPLENPKSALERRNIVLKTMAETGFITDAEAEQAIALPLGIKTSPLKRLQREAAYFTDYVEKELPKLVPAQTLAAGGVVVKTTLNPSWQTEAEEVVERAVSRYGKWQNFQQAALVAIDPKNGQIKAMVGGIDHDKNQFNRVTQAKRQPGSTFKPFVYAAAIAAGKSPYSNYKDAQYVVDGYKPENYGDKYSGREVSMRDALTSSLNVVAVQVLVAVGWNPVIKLAQDMGIESKLLPTYSLALGASEVNLLELTSAYGTFANNGVHQPVHGINQVLDRNGKILYQANFKPKTALNKNTAATMTWMLQDVVNSGTGTPAQIGRPVAGKTGTSDKARDLWFVGYIPQLVTGIWLGNDNNKPTNGASTMSAWMWRQFMLEAVKDIPYQNFPEPNLGKRPVTVTAEPIKPRRTYFTQTTNNRLASSDESSQTEQPTRRRRRVRVQREETVVRNSNSSEPTRRSSRRRSSPVARSSAPAPSPQNAAPAPAEPITVPVTVAAPETRSVPLQVTPPPDVAPPAPPAERR